MTTKAASLRDRIRQLLKEHGDLSPREIAARLGCGVNSARFTKHDVLRHMGKSLPAPERLRQRRETAKTRSVPVLELQASGLTFVEIAKELGVSHGQVAGLVYRARRQASLAESQVGG